MIGNDVIQLSRSFSGDAARLHRYAEKICTAHEQSVFHAADTDDRPGLLSLFWAMKESAWKISFRQHGKRLLNPRDFDCEWEGVELPCFNRVLKGSVHTRGQTFRTEIHRADDVLHCVAWQDESGNQTPDHALCLTTPMHAGWEVRSRLTERVARLAGYAREEIEVRKNPWGVPELYRWQALLPYAVSISHHGDYCGYAITQQP